MIYNEIILLNIMKVNHNLSNSELKTITLFCENYNSYTILFYMQTCSNILIHLFSDKMQGVLFEINSTISIITVLLFLLYI